MEHVAIQNKRYTFDNLETLPVLCRCNKRKDVPYEKVSPGDKIYIQSDGLITVKATVLKVTLKEYDDINDIRNLCKGTKLYDGKNYWNDMKDRHYATVVRLANHEDLSNRPIRPRKRSYGSSWIVMDSEQKRREWLEREGLRHIRKE
ncbi:hypothetical protein ES703_71674 [subsurface metagenome]